MAFADLGTLGSAGNSNNNQASLAMVASGGNCAVGELVVVVVAVDNPQNGGDAGVSSVANSGTANTWTKAVQVCNAVAAQGGASVSIWYSILTAAMTTTTQITATFNNATTSDASAMTARHFSFGAGMTVAIEGTPATLLHNTALDPGALDVTTANIECLRIRGCGIELGSNVNWTPTASWTAWAAGQSATSGTTAEMAARAEHRIFTGTSASSNPTQSAAINANAYVAFRETLPTLSGALAVTEVADTAAFTGNVAAAGAWILVTGVWNDAGVWIDSDVWKDSAATVTGALAVTETADGASLAGNVLTVGAVYFDHTKLGPDIILSNAQLTATQTSASIGNVRGNVSHTAGKYYHEFTVNVAGNIQVGLCNDDLPLNTYLGANSLHAIGVDDGGGWFGAGGTTTAPALIAGHTYGMAIDIQAGKAWCKDITAGGFWNADASANPVTGVNGATFFVDVAPAQAAAVGYNTRTFSSTFTSSEYDVANSKAAGFNWYPWNYFGGSTNLSSIVLNGDTSVTLTGDPSGPNAQISTACDKGGATFVGTAFGGGMYFEATLKFDPAQVAAISFAGFPSWWSMSLEHLIGMSSDTWPGQAANYTHFAEVDVMEYGVSQLVPSVSNDWILFGYHDWYGVAAVNQFTQTVLQSYTAMPVSTYTNYHKYGCLWVPATSSTRGYIRFYFDDAPVGNVYSWYQNTGQPVPGAAVFTTSAPIEDYGWPYNNIRQVLAPSLLGASSATIKRIRVYFRTAAAGTCTFDSCWVGHSAAAGNESNYDGNQVQLTFDNGNSSKTLNPKALAYPNTYNDVVTDWVPFSYDNTKKLVIASHVSGADLNFVENNALTGATIYTSVALRTSIGNPQADNGGVTAPNLPVATASKCIVLKIEVQDYTPLSILDSQHLALILGTYAGAPMTVQSVKVWQASAANNLHV